MKFHSPISFYKSQVVHKRFGEHAYFFRYRILSMLIDIDRLDDVHAKSPFFSVDRFNLLSFHAKDHLAAEHNDLRGWVNSVLNQHGIDGSALQVSLLCMPRVLGWVFNPLSVWYCTSATGELVAVICEVRNTFGERHCYFLDYRGKQASNTRATARKVFHVSPFMQTEGEYQFRLASPDDKLRLLIDYRVAGQSKLVATQIGYKQSFSTRSVISYFIQYPFLASKVLGAIHWHALKLWLSGSRFFSKPEPPIKEVS